MKDFTFKGNQHSKGIERVEIIGDDIVKSQRYLVILSCLRNQIMMLVRTRLQVLPLDKAI